jgi:hypothetical protein
MQGEGTRVQIHEIHTRRQIHLDLGIFLGLLARRPLRKRH